jgi:hypothetical protein
MRIRIRNLFAPDQGYGMGKISNITDPEHWTVFGKGKAKKRCQAKQNRTTGCSTYRVCRSGIMELRFLSLEKCSILNRLHDK